MKPSLVAKCYPNNSNINNTNTTAANREAAAAFKKLKEKGEEKMQAVREQLRDLDFKEEFIEQLLKDYPPRKIEKKLDLLFIKRNIQNPAGWLMAALKDDYPTPHPHLDPPPSRGRKLRESVEINSGQLRIDSRFRGNDIKGSGNDKWPKTCPRPDRGLVTKKLYLVPYNHFRRKEKIKCRC